MHAMARFVWPALVSCAATGWMAAALAQTASFTAAGTSDAPVRVETVAMGGARYVALAEVAEKLGARVFEGEGELTLRRAGRRVTLRPGSLAAVGPSGAVRLRRAPRVEGGRWLVAPEDVSRLFADALGLDVSHAIALRDEAGDASSSIEMRDIADVAEPIELKPIFPAEEDTATGPWNLGVIVVDPGHGGADEGVKTAELKESDVALDIARTLAALLGDRLGAEVYLTRDGDVDAGPHARANVAVRQRADLVISIHAGDAMTAGARGVQAYVIGEDELDRLAEGRTGRVRSVLLKRRRDAQRSLDLARYVTERVAGALGAPDRGVRQGRWRVLRQADTPGVLFELGFLSNPADREQLASGEGREAIAEALADGVTAYAREKLALSR